MKVTLVELAPAGGLFQFAFQLGSALAACGHDVTLVTGPQPELRSEHPNFRIASILPTWRPGTDGRNAWLRKLRRIPRAGRHVLALAMIARHVRDERPDVLQWASWRFGIDGLCAAAIARAGWAAASIDLCHEPRPLQEQRSGAESYYRGGTLLRRGLELGYRSMATTVVLGEGAKADLLQTWPGLGRSDVIPHGDESAFGDASELPPPSTAGPTAMLFGTLTSYKGIGDLLAAWPIVCGSLPDARLRIVGDPTGDLDVADLSRRAAAVPGIELDLRYVPVDDVKDIFAGAALVIAPYRRSNASGAVRLAQTLGRPVVVTRVGDLTESVDEGVSGLIVSPGDIPALAGAITQLLADPTRLDRMGAAGARQLAERASWPVVAKVLEGIYLEITAARA